MVDKNQTLAEAWEARQAELDQSDANCKFECSLEVKH